MVLLLGLASLMVMVGWTVFSLSVFLSVLRWFSLLLPILLAPVPDRHTEFFIEVVLG